MRITGTFLDGITHDIPANDGGRTEWAADFDTMGSTGIVTVVFIRAGVGRAAACPSQVPAAQADILPVYGAAARG